jgi:hypothetical protein
MAPLCFVRKADALGRGDGRWDPREVRYSAEGEAADFSVAGNNATIFYQY